MPKVVTHSNATTPRQFRLGDDILDKMELLRFNLGLRSNADVIRHLVMKAYRAEGLAEKKSGK